MEVSNESIFKINKKQFLLFINGSFTWLHASPFLQILINLL